MASKKELKKDIDYLIFEVIADCFAYKEIMHDNNIDKIAEIINDAVGLRNDLIARINNPEGKDNQRIIKTYFQSVRKDLFEKVDELFSRLSALASAK
jgi:hypothetical protein